MRKGFTLLELIVVIIILGILATLGLTQYARTVERSRGSEARDVAGSIRKFAAAYRMERGTISSVPLDALGIGTSTDQVPSTCVGRQSHYFSYGAAGVDPTITITATRCSSGGKTPQGPASNPTLILISNLLTGIDTFTGSGGY